MDFFLKSHKINHQIESSILLRMSIDSNLAKIESLSHCKYFGFDYRLGFFVYSERRGNFFIFNEVIDIFLVDSMPYINCKSCQFWYIENLHAFVKVNRGKSVESTIDLSENWIEPFEPYFLIMKHIFAQATKYLNNFTLFRNEIKLFHCNIRTLSWCNGLQVY